MVTYGASSFKMRFFTFALNALSEEDCHFENGSSFHSFGPETEYAKLFFKNQFLPLH